MTSVPADFERNMSRNVDANGKRQLSSLEKLAAEPFRFDFFQAVRLLELEAFAADRGGQNEIANPVGEDFFPVSEIVRFRASASQSFPGSEIMEYTPEVKKSDRHRIRTPAQLTVSFLGLTGPSGVLPQHYTQRLIDELRTDDGMREFFDVFNHRLVSLFYRVWKKHHFPVAYESESFTKQELVNRKVDARDVGDLFTYGLYCLIGRGTGGLRGRQVLPDEGLLFFGGQFTQHSPTAISLEQMVGDYFRLPTEVIQFIGQWLQLSVSDQTSLSTAGMGLGNNALGVTAVAGDRVWSIENKFRLRLGPLSYSDYWDFVPGVRQLGPLAQFVRSYVGPEFDFEVQLVLKEKEVPKCQLGGTGDQGAHLGWNTWIFSGSLGKDADELILQVDGMPNFN